MKVGVYIVQKLASLSQLELWSLYALKYFLGHVQLKSTHNLTFTLRLTHGESHCHLLRKKYSSILKYLIKTTLCVNSKNNYFIYTKHIFNM
jgi:hypothetical protein